jgi:hypothetical protein
VEAKIAPAIADAAKAETVFKVDTTTAVDALKTAQAGVQQGVVAAKSDAEIAVESAHGATAAAVSHLESVPSFLSAEVTEAKQRLTAAIGWFEAHIRSSSSATKAPPPVPPVA